MYTPKAYDVSQITWNDIVQKMDKDFSTGDYETLVRDDKPPTFIFKGSWFPEKMLNVLDQVSQYYEHNLHNIDLYVSLSGDSRSHDRHYDFFDLLLVQLVGEMRYLVDDKPCIIEPGDSIYLPSDTYHQPFITGPRATLSIGLNNKTNRIHQERFDNLVNWMRDMGMDKIPHRDSDLLDHSIKVANLLRENNRPESEQIAGLFHSIYGTEFQSYKLLKNRKEIQYTIGFDSENIVHTFCTLKDRTNTILYGKGLPEPMRTNLRWLEYCNIKEQDPGESILREFELVLGLQGKNNDRKM